MSYKCFEINCKQRKENQWGSKNTQIKKSKTMKET